MTMMRRWLRATMLTCGLGLLLTSCSKDGDTVYLPDPTEQQPSTKPLIIVIYDAEGIGDQSYNDLIYQGVEEASRKYNVRTLHISPKNYAEGLTCLETLFQQMSNASDTIRRLCIVANSVYDEFVRKNNNRLESNQRAGLLYLETKTPLQGKGSTLYLPYYGAMYEAGNIAPLFRSHLVLLGANPVNESVAEALKGFTDGFNDRQDDIAQGSSLNFEERTLQTIYLGQKAGEGFSIDDEQALDLLHEYDIDNEYTHMLIPVCGGAGSTFMRLADINGAYTYMGVDCSQTSYFSPFSAVKHIDLAVTQSIGQWLSAEGMPKHQSLGLASGFTEVLLHPNNAQFRVFIQQYLGDDVRDAIHQQAIRKEEAYEKLED